MSTLLKGVKAFLVPLKLDHHTERIVKQLIEKSGGEIVNDQKDATIILTTIKSSARISRHVKNTLAPVLDIQWLKDCVRKQQQLPKDDYVIEYKGHRPGVPQDTERVVSHVSSDVLYRTFKTPQSLPGYSEEDDNSDDESSQSRNDNNDHELDPTFINTKYECLRPTPQKAYHNRKLVALLSVIQHQREIDKEDKNALSYVHAIAAIKAYPRRIRSSQEAAKIIGIGKKIAALIQTYLETGTIPEADQLLADERFQTISLFCKVFGVGPLAAKVWWDSGYRTLQEVSEKAKLTRITKLGIQLLPDFEQPMSRKDVEELIAIIEKAALKIDKQAFVTPVGGYRRGKTKNGDLDILISSRWAEQTTDHLLRKLVDELTEQGYIRHKLWYSDPDTKFKDIDFSGTGENTHVGIDNLDKCFSAFLQPSKQILRQVDLIVTSLEDYPTAVLGWTGSRQFERSLRDYAKKVKNIKATSCGFFARTPPFQRLHVESEEHAFQLLGMEWIPPEMRNC